MDVSAIAMVEKEIVEMCNNKLKLSPPWAIFEKQVKCLFGQDKDIRIEYDEDAPSIKLFVNGQKKAEALMRLLPTEKTFGNVVLKISVIPANDYKEDLTDMIEDAFKGNPVFSKAVSVEGVSATPFVYTIFKNEVAQYFNDDISDANGIASTLYQEIAKEILLDTPGVYYCTEPGENIVKSSKD